MGTTFRPYSPGQELLLGLAGAFEQKLTVSPSRILLKP